MLQKPCGASQVVADDFLQLESIFKKTSFRIAEIGLVKQFFHHIVP